MTMKTVLNQIELNNLNFIKRLRKKINLANKIKRKILKRKKEVELKL